MRSYLKEDREDEMRSDEIFLSVCLSVCLSPSLYVCLSVSVCLSVCWSANKLKLK